MNLRSINGYVVCEPYNKDKGLEAKVSRGFASVNQKKSLKGLKILADCAVGDKVYPAGSIAYFKEEVLYTETWSRMELDCTSLGETKCILAELRFVVMIHEVEG